jgi:iron-sulfur cluster repair protein YtfE (RIC family)
MNGIEPVRSVVGTILAEHKDLHSAVARIKAQLAERDPKAPMSVSRQQLTASLSELHHYLAEHFLREEKGGFLEEAVAKLPRLAKRVMDLEHEHPELLKQIDNLLELIPKVKPTASGWKRLAIEFDRIARRLADHEAAESHLVEEGFNQDVGLTE